MKPFDVILLLSFVLLLSSSEGYVIYNTDDQICCNMRLYNRTQFDFAVECCKVGENGSLQERLYHAENETCKENNEENKILIGKTGKACCFSDNSGDLSNVNSPSELCCDGVLHMNIQIDRHRCCGGHLYNIFNQICCSGEVHHFHYGRKQCCGSDVFDPIKQICSDKKILPHGKRICNDQIIGDAFQICCNGQIHDRRGFGERTLCCDKEQFDPSSQICCDGKVHSTDDASRTHCCGTEVINSSVFHCCSGTKYDHNMFQCCGGELFVKSLKCCGGKIIDENTQVCCPQIFEMPEQVVEKSAENHTECCPSVGGGHSYSKTDSYCSYQGAVVPNDRSSNICGNTKYDVKKDLCCNYVVVQNARTKGLRCCHPGKRVYNPRKQVCCDSVPVNGKSCRPSCTSNCKLTKPKKFLKNVRCRGKVYVIHSKSRRPSRFWSAEALLVRAGQRTFRKSASKFILPKRCKCLQDEKLFLLTRGTKQNRSASVILTKYSFNMTKRILRRQRKLCRRLGR